MIFFSLFSFFLDGIASTLISNSSYLLPLFSIVSLALIYPYLNDNRKFSILSLCMGFLYDIVYTQTLFLNTIAFVLIAIIIYLFYRFVPVNIINSLLCITILIIFFRLFVYLILILLGKEWFEWQRLFASIYQSFIINYLYMLIFYYILKKINKKQTNNHFIK